jgi:hypothetical protein
LRHSGCKERMHTTCSQMFCIGEGTQSQLHVQSLVGFQADEQDITLLHSMTRMQNLNNSALHIFGCCRCVYAAHLKPITAVCLPHLPHLQRCDWHD